MNVPSVGVPPPVSQADSAQGSARGLNRCARPHLVAAAKDFYSKFGGWIKENQLPIVYSEQYNIKFLGVEKLHPFDSCKYGRVVQDLEKRKLLTRSQLVAPSEATTEQLLDVHTPEYLHSLNTSRTKVASVVELPPVALFPVSLLDRYLLKPMRYHVGGTILAVGLALDRGWSINLGGGMHHAYFQDGGGWCVYSDISLAVRAVRRATQGAVQRIMVIDLDVHQGNGVERDKLHFKDDDLYVLDMYNREVYPADGFAKSGINKAVELQCGCSSEQYLKQLSGALRHAFSDWMPDLVLYNAGTDILEGDPLGRINVTAEGIRERDAMVFGAAQQAAVPICMLLSGGYARENYKVVAASIANLLENEVDTQMPSSL